MSEKAEFYGYEYNSDGYDTDLEIPHTDSASSDQCPTPNRHWVSSSTESGVYEASCREEGVLPFSVISRGLTQPFIRLRYQSIGRRAIKPLCIALATNQVVTVLDLEDTDLDHHGAVYLAQTFKQNFTIRHLNIANNNIGDTGVSAIVKALYHQPTVSYLNISGNKLTDKFGRNLETLLKENDFLRRLHASYNSMRREAAAAIGEGLRINKTLVYLDLSWNVIPGSGATELFLHLQKNNSLETLNLSWNGIGYEGGQGLADLVSKNTGLCQIDMTSTRIMWQNMDDLATGLRINQHLKVIKLGQNPLTTTGAMALLEAVSGDHCALQLLDLTDVPVVAEFQMLASAIQRIRPFQFIHGGIVNSHDYLGRQVLGTVALKSGTTIKHPMQIVLEFVRKKRIRLLDLFRSMDKTVLLRMTDRAFLERLKRFGMPLTENQLEALTKAISRKGTDKSEITYPKLVRSVADHIRKERDRKTSDTKFASKVVDEKKSLALNFAQTKTSHRNTSSLPRLIDTRKRSNSLRKFEI